MELGGKTPHVVFADADAEFDQAVVGAVSCILWIKRGAVACNPFVMR